MIIFNNYNDVIKKKDQFFYNFKKKIDEKFILFFFMFILHTSTEQASYVFQELLPKPPQKGVLYVQQTSRRRSCRGKLAMYKETSHPLHLKW